MRRVKEAWWDEVGDMVGKVGTLSDGSIRSHRLTRQSNGVGRDNVREYASSMVHRRASRQSLWRGLDNRASGTVRVQGNPAMRSCYRHYPVGGNKVGTSNSARTHLNYTHFSTTRNDFLPRPSGLPLSLQSL